MYCKYCGTFLPENSHFCASCGAPAGPVQDNRSVSETGRIGYSNRIHDQAFTRYIKKSNRWSAIFSIFIAVAAVIGFTIYGEIGTEMNNPQSFYIGLGIGGMFILIAVVQILGRNRSKTWDGTVVDKIIRKKSRRQSTGGNDNDYDIQYYTEYTVIIREDRSGKSHMLIAEDDDRKYNYFQVGDRVRHHAGLNSYEKYDKSRDSVIFCNACGTLCSINDDTCYRCKCPLLK